MTTFQIQITCGTIGVIAGVFAQHWDAATWAFAYLVTVWSHK
jgi:hypothetical protein